MVKKQAEFRAQAGKGQGKRQTKEKHTWQQYQKTQKHRQTHVAKGSKQFTKTDKTHVAKSVQKAVYKHRQNLTWQKVKNSSENTGK